MASDINEIIITGNLGRDPDNSRTAGGKSITKFSVACNESYSIAEGEKKESTTWFNVVAFDSRADNCYQYLKKGSFVVVIGKLSIRKYAGRDGQEKTSTEIIVDKIRFMGVQRPRQEDQENGSYRPEGSSKSTTPVSQQATQENVSSGSRESGIDDLDIPY